MYNKILLHGRSRILNVWETKILTLYNEIYTHEICTLTYTHTLIHTHLHTRTNTHSYIPKQTIN